MKVLVLLATVQESVGDLLEPLEAQVEPADHQQRHHRPRRHSADQERGGDQDRLVDQGALGDREDHGQLPIRPDPAHLLGVEGQVVPQHAGRLLGSDLGQEGHVVGHRRALLGRDLGHQRDVVQDGGDVVDQGEQAAGGHRGARIASTSPAIMGCT